MSDLTEFDHAIDAAFKQRPRDLVQTAWLESTVYWTEGICDMYILYIEEENDEWEIPDPDSGCIGWHDEGRPTYHTGAAWTEFTHAR